MRKVYFGPILELSEFRVEMVVVKSLDKGKKCALLGVICKSGWDKGESARQFPTGRAQNPD